MQEQTRYNGRLWIEKNGEPVIGPGRVELLERIMETGSIRQAAMQMEMSYRQAWQMLNHMNSNCSAPVLVSQRGGKGGGSAEVTAHGLAVIKQFRDFHKQFHAFLAQNSHLIKI